MKKKIFMFFLLAFVLNINKDTIIAIDSIEFQNNMDKYLNLCEYEYSANREVCDEFKEYLEEIGKQANNQLQELKKSQSNIVADITQYTQKLNKYNESIHVLQDQTRFYQKKIEESENDLSVLHSNVLNYEQGSLLLMDTIYSKFLKVQSIANTPILSVHKPNQKTANIYLKSSEKDFLILREINRNLETLEKDQFESLKEISDLEEKKNKMQEKLSIANELQLEVRKILVEYRRQEAEIIKNLNVTIKELDKVKEDIVSVTGIQNITSSLGWIKPVQDGYVSAGTWHYPASFGGGPHTGIDYAAKIGTNIYAPANGVVLFSTYGCKNDGYLGNRCGADGLAMAGNQMYIIINVNNKSYAVSFYHMNDKTAPSSGTIIQAGDKIGEIGASGNVSGPHAHIEVTYLGTMSVDAYVKNWDGDLTFGVGIGKNSLKNTCTNKNGQAPCKLQPETVFGEEIKNE